MGEWFRRHDLPSVACRFDVVNAAMANNDGPGAAFLARKFGLSPGESKTLALLCQGYGAEAIARKRHAGFGTVRAQLCSLYRKRGWGHMGEAIAASWHQHWLAQQEAVSGPRATTSPPSLRLAGSRRFAGTTPRPYC